jgi:hypothetical protein
MGFLPGPPPKPPPPPPVPGTPCSAKPVVPLVVAELFLLAQPTKIIAALIVAQRSKALFISLPDSLPGRELDARFPLVSYQCNWKKQDVIPICPPIVRAGTSGECR